MVRGEAQATVIAESGLPLVKSDRTWGAIALYGNSASAAVATWCFINGSYLSYYLPAGPGTVVMIAGILIGLFFVMTAALPVSTRYGIETIRASRPQFGARGSAFALLVVVAMTAGWNALLVIFLGRSGAAALVSMDVISESSRTAVEIVLGLVSLAVVFFLLRGGPETLRNVGPWIAGAVILLSIAIFAILLSEVGWSTIVNAKALAPYDDSLLNYATGTELMIASGLSWWPYMGAITRMSPSTRKSMLPVILGLGVTMAIICLVGLYASLAVPESGGDPTDYLIQVGGPVFGVVALAFIIIANVGTSMVGIYVCALSLKQNRSFDKRVTWNQTTLLSLAPVAVLLLFFAGPFVDHFGTFLAFVGVTLGPMCGVQISDYYFVRRQRLDINAIYDDTPNSRYWYWGGFNPAGFLGMAAGVATYLILLDPVTFEAAPAFKYITASVPSLLVAAAVYWGAFKLLCRSHQANEPRRGDELAPATALK